MSGTDAVRTATLRFKQLAALGIAPETVIPALLQELHEIVPSLTSTFYFTDTQGETSHIYLENTEYYPLLPIYWSIIHERSERVFKGNSFKDAAATLFGPHTREGSVVDRETILRSDPYNLTERVVGYDPNFLRIIVRASGNAVGGVRLWRSFGRRQWSAEDARRLAALEPFFAHAVTSGCTSLTDDRLDSTAGSGLVIAKTDGRIVYFTPAGRRALLLATHEKNGPRTTFGPADQLPPAIARMCTQLSRLFAGDAATPAPTVECRNIWGSFTFRAQWLEEPGSTAQLVAITTTHREPRKLRLARSAQRLSLTARQTEVCILMAEGLTNDAIADRLGISRHTAREHGRCVFNRLGVHSRVELANHLLAH